MMMEQNEQTPTETPLRAKVEACLFASIEPLAAKDILSFVSDPEEEDISQDSITSTQVEKVIEEIAADFPEDAPGKGFFLAHIPGSGYQFQTSKQVGETMKRLFASRPRTLSKAAQETLAIIAYRQPCTRATIDYIRGVDSGSIVKNLLDKGLVSGKRDTEALGRPMVFSTTNEFLRVFNLASLGDLPPLQNFSGSQIKESLEDINKFERQASGEEDEPADGEEAERDQPTLEDTDDSAPTIHDVVDANSFVTGNEEEDL